MPSTNRTFVLRGEIQRRVALYGTFASLSRSYSLCRPAP